PALVNVATVSFAAFVPFTLNVAPDQVYVSPASPESSEARTLSCAVVLPTTALAAVVMTGAPVEPTVTVALPDFPPVEAVTVELLAEAPAVNSPDGETVPPPV